MSLFTLDSRLEYRRLHGDGESIPLPEEADFEPLQLRPTSYERGRRLAMVVASRPEITKVAIAMPEHDSDTALGRGFGDAMRAIGRETVRLDYAPGRRNYAPEAEQFIGSAAQAILFTGAGEESGEWLSALAKRKVRPVFIQQSFDLRVQVRLGGLQQSPQFPLLPQYPAQGSPQVMVE
jgi:hypothetical protein